MPLVSVVTPSFNQAQFLERTLRSVLEQAYPHIEYIVVDGASTDGTLEILERYGDRLRWVSEPDQGQTHAINKGFSMAKGSILAWLNSDDLYTPGAIATVVEYFQTHPEAMFVYGDAAAIDDRDRLYGLRAHVKACDRRSLVEEGDFIVQPAAFWRRELWEAVGPLDESLHYTMDYEYWMRAAEQFDLHYLPVCLAYERIYPLAKTSKGSIERIEEIEQVARRHGGSGLPRNFRPEGTANYIWRALGSAARFDWQSARQDIANASRLGGSATKVLLYLASMTLFSAAGVPKLRLLSNRLRSNRPIVWPSTS